METVEVTLAERGQIVIPKEARDALGLKPGSRLQVRIESGRLVIEKRVQLDLSRWIGKAVDDGLTTDQALAELRARPVPWREDAVGKEDKEAALVAAPESAPVRKPAKRKSATVSRVARQP